MLVYPSLRPAGRLGQRLDVDVVVVGQFYRFLLVSAASRAAKVALNDLGETPRDRERPTQTERRGTSWRQPAERNRKPRLAKGASLA